MYSLLKNLIQNTLILVRINGRNLLFKSIKNLESLRKERAFYFDSFCIGAFHRIYICDEIKYKEIYLIERVNWMTTVFMEVGNNVLNRTLHVVGFFHFCCCCCCVLLFQSVLKLYSSSTFNEISFSHSLTF